MPTPTKKPVDLVTVSLSDADFMRVVGDSMAEVLNHEYNGRIEVIRIGVEKREVGPDRWVAECAFIPRDDD